MKKTGRESEVDEGKIRQLRSDTLLSQLPAVKEAFDTETDVSQVGKSVEDFSNIWRKLIILHS